MLLDDATLAPSISVGRSGMGKRVWRLTSALVLGLVALGALLLERTWTPSPLPAPVDTMPIAPLALEAPAVLRRLAGAVRLPTVSTSDAPPPIEQLRAFHAYLAQQFPRVHNDLVLEEVGHGALLFTWKGSDATQTPIIFSAHQDTVPVDPETRARWLHDPWSGEISDGVLWGRGALDDKASLVSILEAAEQLLQQGFVPRRTIYFAFGSDEERGGQQGAKAIAQLLQQRGVHAGLVLDEGGAITRELLPGVPGEFAVVGVAEKGFATVRLTVLAAGGHSSQPSEESAIGILSRAMVKLEVNQFPARVTPAAKAMLDAVAPLLPFRRRMLVRNRWLFEPMLINELARTPAGNALVRTTTAETTFQAGVNDNMLPSMATGTVNYRILPGESVGDVLAHVRRVVDDARVEIALGAERVEPSVTSPVDGEGFATVSRTIRQVLPDAPVVPFLVTGATYSRHYIAVTDEQLRFVPYRLMPRNVGRIHGIDEGIEVIEYLDCVRFAFQFMRNAAG
jgi:carboxypeptidase PM20D1